MDGFFKLDMNNDLFAIVSSSSNLCDESIKWHAKISHIGQGRMNRLAQEGLLGSLAKVDLSTCKPCLARKAGRKPFAKATCAAHPLELIHSGICGPMNVRAWHGACYFLTFVDDYFTMAMYICFLTIMNL